MLYTLLFVTACHAILYLLLHAVQLAICYHMPCSLLLVAAHCIACLSLPLSLSFIATPTAQDNLGKLGAVKTRDALIPDT